MQTPICGLELRSLHAQWDHPETTTVLYQDLLLDYKKVIDHAVEGGKLSLMVAQDQFKDVRIIVTLSDEDTLIHFINCTFMAYQNLPKCIRRRLETPSSFAERFSAKASEYMVLACIDTTGIE